MHVRGGCSGQGSVEVEVLRIKDEYLRCMWIGGDNSMRVAEASFIDWKIERRVQKGIGHDIGHRVRIMI